jgi:hypothetical protein
LKKKAVQRLPSLSVHEAARLSSPERVRKRQIRKMLFGSWDFERPMEFLPGFMRTVPNFDAHDRD